MKYLQTTLCLAAVIATVFSYHSHAQNSSGTYGNLQDKIREITERHDAETGVAVIINGKDTVTVNNSCRYPMMSVFKFHQALAVSDWMQRNGVDHDLKVHITAKDLEKDTYSPLRDKYPEGNVDIPVGVLLELTLQLSDNNACDILFDRFCDISETDSYIRSLGISDFAIEVNEKDMHSDLDNCYRNWSTPLAAACLLEKFVNGETVSGKYFDFIKSTMTGCTTGNGRLPKPLKDSGALTGHKTGTGDKNREGAYIGINDIGFIELPAGDRYVIAVFVKDSRESFEETETIISEISSVVYDAIAHER